MKELLELIAKSLVDQPEDVAVSEIEGEQTTVLELKVAQQAWLGGQSAGPVQMRAHLPVSLLHTALLPQSPSSWQFAEQKPLMAPEAFKQRGVVPDLQSVLVVHSAPMALAMPMSGMGPGD